jgi:plastocyanin
VNTRKLIAPLMLVVALIISACGGGAPIAEQPTAAPAAQPTAAPAAQPTTVFESVPEPTVGALPTAAPTAAPQAVVQAAGALSWRDQILRNDSVLVSATGLPAPQAGQVYAAWLGGKDGSLPLGALSATGNPATLTFISPINDNLLGKFDQVYITQASAAAAAQDSKSVLLAGGLPEKALVHIRHVLFSIGNTPNKIGFALGLRQETDELLRHAQFLNDALDAGDFRLVKVHAEHINNIVKGSEASDLNGDGKVQSPSDGFGLLPNGEQDGYIKGVIDHAKLAADAPDATDAIKLHAGHIQIAGENIRLRIQEVLDLANDIAKAGAIEETRQSVLKILALAQQAIQGIDINGDEQVGPVPGEGGVLVAYQHAQLMASVPLTADVAGAVVPPLVPEPTPAPPPQNAPASPAPAAGAKTVVVAIGDNTFSPGKITIPLGATVAWTHKGQKPHTVTADDGSFNSGNLDAGASFKQTFTKAGTFPYYCEYHGGPGGQGMAGAIVVVDKSSAVQPQAAPPAPAKPTAPPPPPAPTAAPAPAPAAGEVPVEIGDNTYTPKELSVPVGTKVVWTHKGQKPHTVTADDGSFKSETLQNGATFAATFDKPGTYAYFCEFHGGASGQGMAAVITVVDGGAPAQVAPPPPPPAPAAGEVPVEIGDNTYTPKELSVPVGATVVWTHKGQKKHTVTADDGWFKSDVLLNGASFKQTFDKPGIYPYYCEIHGGAGGQGMSGVVKVGDGGYGAPPPAEAPAAAPPAEAPAAAPPPPAPAPVAAAVSMKDFDFDAKEVKVKVGTTITWKNDGAKKHSATAADGSFDTGLYGSGESKSITFDKPGTFLYYCQLHGTPDGSGMVGTVIVEP